MQLKGRALSRLLAVCAALAMVLGYTSASAGASAAGPGNKTYSGYSHDIKVGAVGGTITAGPIVAAGVGCSDRATLFFQDDGANVTLGGVTLGAVTTKSEGLKSGAVQETRSTFQASGVNIPLGIGSLTADTITVVSKTFYDTTAQTFSTTSTMTVANLVIRLSPVGPTVVQLNGTINPNTGINVPGLATVMLHSSEDLGGDIYGAMSNMAAALNIQLLGATTSVTVGEVYSLLYGETDQTFMFGEGQGLTVHALDDVLRVGPLVTAQLPCYGNGGVTSNVAGVGGLAASLGSVGVIESTATGTRSGLSADAETTSSVAGVNLLDGLITADVIGSSAHVTTSDGGQTVSTSGSSTTLANLTVAGAVISADTPDNTVINLPGGLGYVVVNAKTSFGVGIEVIPLVVHVNAVNADIVIARSYALLLGPEISAPALRKAEQFLEGEVTLTNPLPSKSGKKKKVSESASPRADADNPQEFSPPGLDGEAPGPDARPERAKARR